MLFSNLMDWDDAFLFFGDNKYLNTHKDTLANHKRYSYRLAYYEWKPDKKLAGIPLTRNYPSTK